LFNLAAAAGIDSPTKFSKKHVVFKNGRGQLEEIEMKEKVYL